MRHSGSNRLAAQFRKRVKPECLWYLYRFANMLPKTWPGFEKESPGRLSLLRKHINQLGSTPKGAHPRAAARNALGVAPVSRLNTTLRYSTCVKPVRSAIW